MLSPVGEVEVEARKRIVTPQGVARPAAEFDEIAMGVGPSASIPGNGNGGGVKGLVNPSMGKRWRHASSASQPSSASSSSPSPSPANLHVDAHGHLSLDGVHTKVEGGLLLSAEEIKDAVCCTALWLVVREGFGGVGRVKRQGDGWRIRG